VTVLTFWAHKIELWGGGALAYCPTCGGAEGDLPEHCPQRKMTEQERIDVYADLVDYRRGRWTTWTRSKEMAARRMLT
jgi:hypothetical protein